MKTFKTIISVLFPLMACQPMAAQWTPGDYSMTVLDQGQDVNFYNPTMIRKADGGSVLTYRTFGVDEYFYLHLQVLDPVGNPLLPAKGVKVLRNGHLFILRNDKTYDVVGRQTR